MTRRVLACMTLAMSGRESCATTDPSRTFPDLVQTPPDMSADRGAIEWVERRVPLSRIGARLRHHPPE
jgi:hypothetical protein